MPYVISGLLAAWQNERLRLLCLVLVFVAFVNFQFFRHGPAQLVLGQHTHDRFLNTTVRPTVKKLAVRFFAQPAGETSVMAIHLLFGLRSPPAHLPPVHHHYMTPHIA